MTGGSTHAPGRSSTATGRPAPWRGRCWSGRRRSSGRCRPPSCRAENGVVIPGEPARPRSAQLAEAAAKLPPPTSVKLKDPKDWKLIGKPTTPPRHARRRSPARPQFGIDVQLPGLADRARRAPAGLRRQGEERSTPRRRRRCPACETVVQVLRRRRGRRALLGGASTAATRSRSTGTSGPGAALDTGELREEYRALARTPGPMAADDGRRRPRRWPARRDGSRPSTTSRTSRTRRWSRSTARCEIGAGPLRDLDRHAVPDAATRTVAAQIAGLKPEQVKIHTHVPRRRLRPPREPDLATSSPRRCRSPRRPACRSRWSGRARTTCAAATTGRRASTACEVGARRRRDCRSPGSTRSSASRSSPARRSRR